jgi:hypothetical protein
MQMKVEIYPDQTLILVLILPTDLDNCCSGDLARARVLRSNGNHQLLDGLLSSLVHLQE